MIDPVWLARAREGLDEGADIEPDSSPGGVLMLARALHEAGNHDVARAAHLVAHCRTRVAGAHAIYARKTYL